MQMNTYKVIFAKNTPISCDQLPGQTSLKSEYYYEHKKGQLIYALINAASEQDALVMAAKIIKEVTERTFGVDYIQ